MVRNKIVYQAALIIMLPCIGTAVNAVQLVGEANTVNQQIEVVNTDFGKTGVITKGLTKNAILQVDGIDYELVNSSGLSKSELDKGVEIFFNTEEHHGEMSKITKVWLK